MVFAKYKDSNFTECVELFIQVFNASPWNDKWTFEKANTLLTSFVSTPGFIGYIGKDEIGIKAVCLGHRKEWWNSSEYYIEEMYVDKNEQNKGYGSRMFEYIYKDIIDRGIKAITLITDRDTFANDFYDKNGFYSIDSMVFKKKILG
jgi:aminoglycoside 6'-N-acetyltransferase I